MSNTITERREIPDAPYYVMSNDSFMSGWGPAKGRINTIILPCESLREARIVEWNAGQRTDQQRVRIARNKPRLRDGVLYSLMDKEEASRWYEPGGFAPTFDD
ncbi:MAG: hypothetical protein R6U98_06665 [Pirellulaceae bacterium]